MLYNLCEQKPELKSVYYGSSTVGIRKKNINACQCNKMTLEEGSVPTNPYKRIHTPQVGKAVGIGLEPWYVPFLLTPSSPTKSVLPLSPACFSW